MEKNLIHILIFLLTVVCIDPDSPSDPPKVGDFFYKNSTWSSTYRGTTENPCIGLVFAVGSGVGDKAENYPGKGIKRIRGYVVAVKDTDVRIHRFCTLPSIQTESISMNGKRYSGYTDTQAIHRMSNYSATNYPAVASCLKYNEVLPTPTGTSGWYLPSDAQMTAIANAYYNPTEATEGILLRQLQVLHKRGKGKLLGHNNYWTSTINQAGKPTRVSFNNQPNNKVHGHKKGTTTDKTALTRAIFTF